MSFGKEDAMNTARLKNIVILILLLANAFLLVLLFSRRAEENLSLIHIYHDSAQRTRAVIKM